MKIDIDLSSGKLSVESSEEKLKEVLSQVELFLPVLKTSLVDHDPDADNGGVEKVKKESDPKPARPRRRKKAKENGIGATPKIRKNSSGRIGPKAALSDLIAKDYFSAAKNPSQIRDHLKHKTGTEYSPQEIAVSLVRLMRDGKLDRNQNSDNVYEYTNPSAK
ncbi:MAG: hypothetical protein JWO13_2227 [Acidobacteriales bacterium]|nr:hypothetical protein [Terriglobales bacterium]